MYQRWIWVLIFVVFHGLFDLVYVRSSQFDLVIDEIQNQRQRVVFCEVEEPSRTNASTFQEH